MSATMTQLAVEKLAKLDILPTVNSSLMAMTIDVHSVIGGGIFDYFFIPSLLLVGPRIIAGLYGVDYWPFCPFPCYISQPQSRMTN